MKEIKIGDKFFNASDGSIYIIISKKPYDYKLPDYYQYKFEHIKLNGKITINGAPIGHFEKFCIKTDNPKAHREIFKELYGR